MILEVDSIVFVFVSKEKLAKDAVVTFVKDAATLVNEKGEAAISDFI